jgi:hypothetical protein
LKRVRIAVICVAVIGVGFAVVSRTASKPAAAAGGSVSVYSAKFACGQEPPPSSGSGGAAQNEAPVKPGNYATTINVHNPNLSTVNFVKKAVVTYSSDMGNSSNEAPQAPGALVAAQLKADYALAIDCGDISSKLLQGHFSSSNFIEGFVVIYISPSQQLDVQGLYTGFTFTKDSLGNNQPQGFSEQVVPIAAKQVPTP